jgi:hypothetical protein
MSDAARRRLIRYLARGGAVIREEVGGCIGVRCCGAARTGREFDPEALDRLIAQGGATVNREPRQLVRDAGAAEVFRLTPTSVFP